MRIFATLVAAGLAAFGLMPPSATARPFTPEDLLAAEEFGQIAFAPGGRWLVVETLRGQAVSGPFDLDTYTGVRRGQLWVIDLAHPSARRPIGQPKAGDGLTAGPLSPDGRRLAVLRARGGTWRLGIADLATGRVVWTRVTPELGELGQTIIWRSASRILVAARPAGHTPFKLHYGGAARGRAAALWTTARVGAQPTFTAYGSGRFLSLRPKDPPGAIDEVDAVSGQVRRVGSGDFYDLELSPDGEKVAAVGRFEDLQAPLSQRLRVASDSRRRNLVWFDLATGARSTPCPQCALATHLISWSPDSRRILAFGAEPEGDGGEHLLVLSASEVERPATPRLQIALDATSEGYEIPPAGWLDDQPVAKMRRTGEPRSDWWRMSASGPVALTADLKASDARPISWTPHGMVLAAAGFAWRVGSHGPLSPLFAMDAPWPRQGLGLSNRLKVNQAPATGWALTSGLEGRQALRSTDGDNVELPAGPGEILQVAVRAGAAAVVRRAPDQSLTLDLVRTGRSRRLMTLNPQFAQIEFARPKPLDGVGADGAKVRHWLLLPPDEGHGASPPLVVLPYPGPRQDRPPTPYGNGTGHFPVNPYLLAARGFAVLVPTLLRDPSSTEPGQGVTDQIIAAVDLAAATGQVDAGRLALYGHSFGGYTSLMAATQSRRFRSVIASDAPSDLAQMYGQFDAAAIPQDGPDFNGRFGWAELGQGHLVDPPWVAPELYRRNSPYYLADRISCPVLLLHGDSDFIAVQQAQAMFSALYRQRKDAKLVVLHGEGHVPAGPANVRAMYQIIFDWLSQTLGPADDAHARS